MILSERDSLSSTSLLSLGVREKKEISEAEIMAEKHKNNKEMASATTELTETGEI
jgi:hypothetical protein